MPLTTAACNAAQDSIGYAFSNSELLLEALDTTGMRTTESNQRLAMLGDALLKLILLESWYPGGTSKGLLATRTHQWVVFNEKQVKVTIWYLQLAAMLTWPSWLEMPISISM